MRYRAQLRNERGIALVVVLLVVLAVAAIAAGAALLSSSTTLISKYHDRLSVLEATADAGLEEGRSLINGIKNQGQAKKIFPTSGYVALENGVAVYAADGSVIPNVQRWIYSGPSGVTTGQFGVFGSIVVVVQDAQGDRVVRRGEIWQDSFAKYAYFTNTEGSVVFGGGDQIFGPVFSNDNMTIISPGATFWGPVATAKTINGTQYGTFKQGYTLNVSSIPFPQTADLNNLQSYGAAGGTSITSTTSGSLGQATTRIEFVAVDLNGDGNTTDPDEGFMKIYQVTKNSDAWWVVADTGGSYGSYSANGVKKSRNCGHVLAGTHSYFMTFAHHASAGADNQTTAVTTGTNIRCYLGGSDILNDWTATPGSFLSGATKATGDSLGVWLPWTGAPVDARVTAARPADAAYLWPVSRALNPNFKGVIYVSGNVAVSGTLRGQVTLAATGNIVIPDGLYYVTNPGSTTPCGSPQRDMLGLFAGNDVVVADNLINDPIPATSGGAAQTWGATPDEYVQAVVLALTSFTVENYASGTTKAQPCGTTTWGRGCLYLTGGLIQQTRGAVGTAAGTGNLKRYSYDACAGTNPPPYFPTTGWFTRGHYYEVEPTGFNIDSYWALLTPH